MAYWTIESKVLYVVTTCINNIILCFVFRMILTIKIIFLIYPNRFYLLELWRNFGYFEVESEFHGGLLFGSTLDLKALVREIHKGQNSKPMLKRSDLGACCSEPNQSILFALGALCVCSWNAVSSRTHVTCQLKDGPLFGQ